MIKDGIIVIIKDSVIPSGVKGVGECGDGRRRAR